MILTVTSAVILVFAKNVSVTGSRGSIAAGGPAQINFLLAGTGSYYSIVSGVLIILVVLAYYLLMYSERSRKRRNCQVVRHT